MLNVFMLNIANKHFVLSVVILSVVRLNFVILSVVRLNVVILSVVRLNVVILSVVAPNDAQPYNTQPSRT